MNNASLLKGRSLLAFGGSPISQPGNNVELVPAGSIGDPPKPALFTSPRKKAGGSSIAAWLRQRPFARSFIPAFCIFRSSRPKAKRVNRYVRTAVAVRRSIAVRLTHVNRPKPHRQSSIGRGLDQVARQSAEASQHAVRKRNKPVSADGITG